MIADAWAVCYCGFGCYDLCCFTGCCLGCVCLLMSLFVGFIFVVDLECL